MDSFIKRRVADTVNDRISYADFSHDSFSRELKL